MPNDHQYHPLTIVDVVEETVDSRTFVFDVPTALEEHFAYRPGQFCTIRASVGGAQIARSYSMSSAPELGEAMAVTVKRVPGGLMSNWMIDSLVPGDRIDVLRPAGLFVLRHTDVPIVAFAGGSGVTPVFSLVKAALATTQRRVLLVDANRDAGSVIFAEQIRGLERDWSDRLVVHSHLDELDGLLDPHACADLVGDRLDADFYVCGPGPFMDAVEGGLALLGVGDTQLFIERFVTPGDIAPEVEEATTELIVIKHQRRKTSGDYRSGDTILDTARRLGVTPPFSCEGGSCASCMALVDPGSAMMRVNNALTPAEVEEGWVLTCQAVPTSRELTVDYDA